MKTSTEKVLAALSGLIPAEAQQKISEAVDAVIKQTVADLDSTYDARLKEAYAQAQAKIDEAERIGEEGYKQALEMMIEMRDGTERLQEEYRRQLFEGYEDAYQKLLSERKKKDALEVDLYEEYDEKAGRIREFYIEMMDRFLRERGDEFFEAVKRSVMSEPAYAETKVALQKVHEALQPFLADEDYSLAANGRIDGLQKQLGEQVAKTKIVEARNMRLQTENNKLTEVARYAKKAINESVKVEQKVKREAVKNAQSRGQRVAGGVQLIAETNNAVLAESDAGRNNGANSDQAQTLIQQWRKLSGLTD